MSFGTTYEKDEYGIWLVEGEDPNADMFGSHRQPVLGYFEGRYDEVYEYAQTLERWTTWGRGGDVTKIHVNKVDSDTIRQKIALREKKASLEAQVKTLEAQIEDLDKEL